MADKVFADGMIVKVPQNAPDFVIAKASFKVEEFIQFLKQNDNNGWVNVDLLIGKSGKPYAKLNDWKPQGQTNENYSDFPANSGDELPF